MERLLITTAFKRRVNLLWIIRVGIMGRIICAPGNRAHKTIKPIKTVDQNWLGNPVLILKIPHRFGY